MSKKPQGGKREARRERAEQEQQERERRQRQRKFQNRVFIVLGALGLLAIAVLTVTRDDGSNSGRVWSAEHGHWHEK